MSNEENQKSGLEMIVPEGQTVHLNGVEIEAKPVENEEQLKAAMQSEKRGNDNIDFFLELVAATLNQEQNEEFEDVEASEIRSSRGNILPLLTAVQEANGLSDFLDEEDIEKIK